MSPEEFRKYFDENFNTELTPEQDAQFQQWAAEESKRKGYDVRLDQQDYDIKGAFLALQNGDMKEDERGHLGDKFKKPNHPTFSDQSMYNGTPDPIFGGKFEGGTWADDNSWYAPSKKMIDTTHPVGFLQDYMKEREKKSQLRLPEGILKGSK